MTIVFDSDLDRFGILSVDGDSFTVVGSPTSFLLGFGGTGTNVSSVVGLGGEVAWAPRDWSRGDVEVGVMRITIGADNLDFGDVGHVSSLLHVMPTGIYADADNEYRFGLTNEGHLFYSTAEAMVPTGAMKEFLGFSGLETGVTVGSWTTYTADYPMSGVWVPSRPLARRLQSTENDTSSIRLLSGKHVFHQRGAYTTLSLEAWVDGPQDAKDLYKHVLERFAPLAHPGARVDYYERWGDPRTGLEAREIGLGQPAFSIEYNSYNNGEAGRVKCYCSEEMADYVITWPEDLRRRAPLTLKLNIAHDLED